MAKRHEEEHVEDQVVTVTYLAEPGPHNTDATLAAARARARALGISHVVVASDTGKTARKVREVFGEGTTIVAVTNSEKLRLPVSKLHDYTERFRGHREALEREGVKAVSVGMTDEAMDALRDLGVEVSRIDWNEFNRFVKRDVNALEIVGVAVRVAITCAVWALINGDLPEGVEVISVAGTGFGGGGADTALVIRTGGSWRDFRVLETVVRPRESPPSLW